MTVVTANLKSLAYEKTLYTPIETNFLEELSLLSSPLRALADTPPSTRHPAVNLGTMSSTSQQQTPPAPALTDTELTHLATALTGYTSSTHPAYRAAATRTALDALASIKAHIWESAAAHLECTQHLEAAAILWSAQPYYAPRPATATIEQVRAVLAHSQPHPAPQQDKTAALRAALDTLTTTPLESITAAIQLTDNDRAALAALASARLDTCPVCGDLVPEDNRSSHCSVFCQQQDTSA